MRPDMSDPGLRRRYLETILGVNFSADNRVEVLRNGVEIFPAMLEAIRGARISIEMLTYVYWSGTIAEKFAEALSERAISGVNVRVLLDAVGAAKMPVTLIERMRDAGVDVEWFRPITRWKVWNVDNRTHRKTLVCDNHVGFTGGVGIAEEWEGDARNPNEWRETHLRLEGSCVSGLTGAFWDDWFQMRGYSELPEVRLTQMDGKAGDSQVQIVASNALREGSENGALLAGLMRLAQKRLFITTAYFVPNDLYIKLLIGKVQAGVDVKIIVPGRYTDQRFDQLAGEDIFQELLDGGVEIYRYQKTMMHAKVILVDDDLAMVGSTNFNNRSISKDDEVSAVVSDVSVVKQLDSHFKEDLRYCDRVHTWRWNRRGMLQRVGETVTKPFKGQL